MLVGRRIDDVIQEIYLDAGRQDLDSEFAEDPHCGVVVFVAGRREHAGIETLAQHLAELCASFFNIPTLLFVPAPAVELTVAMLAVDNLLVPKPVLVEEHQRWMLDLGAPHVRGRLLGQELGHDLIAAGDILFDQLLVPPSMNARVVEGSVQVFDHAVAAKGNSSNRASDHLPVVAEFVFEDSDAEVPALQIASLLPNPTDKDAGNEEFTLKNNTDSVIDLAGWVLRDRAGNEFALSGTVNGNDDRRIKMTSFSMPLNNSGDEISLIDDSGDVVDHVVFRKEQVQAGVLIVFQ